MGHIIIQTLEASIDEEGRVQLLQDVRLPAARRALVTILEEPARETRNEASLLSEAALSDWNRAEEDEAWSHLQGAR